MWLEHLLFGARPLARRSGERKCKVVFSDQSFLHITAHPAGTDGSSLTILREKIKEVRKTEREVCISRVEEFIFETRI